MLLSKIKKIKNQGEGINIEFKRAKEELPSSLFETICAFLNRNGGTILLGVSDKGETDGVNPSKADFFCKNITNLSNNPQKLFPTFLLTADIVTLNKKMLLHIFVPISSQVHKTNNKIYDRSSDGDFELTSAEQIKNLYLRKSSQYSENTIYPYLTTLDFSEGIVDRVRRLIKVQRSDHPWNELSNDEFFKAAGLFRKDMASNLEGFTLSALLLFGKPEAIGNMIPHYKIDALLRIKDKDRYDDRENIKCNLVEAYDKLMLFVAKHLPDKFYLEGDQRISLRDVIFREVIANLLIHREYTNAFPSSFVIYIDKLEVKNANRPHFYGQLLPAEFEPFPKNPHIAQIFTQLGRSEELGTGVRKVYKYSKAYSGSNDIEFIEQDNFITKIPLDNIFSNIHDTLNDTLNDILNDTLNNRQLRIIELIKQDNLVTIEKMANICTVSIETIKRDIKKLKKQNLIKRIGGKKTGTWRI